MAKGHLRFTVNATRKRALEFAADDRGVSFEKLISSIIDAWLEAGGYLTEAKRDIERELVERETAARKS